MPIDERWYVWMLEQQKKHNFIVAMGTVIIAIVGILQIIKLYDFVVPDWFLFVLGGFITICLTVIIIALLDKEEGGV